MTSHDPEIEQLRATVNCAALLERLPPPWRFDRRQSTPHCLKYRRENGEILIVSHQGRGWWDPQSDAKGDVFDLVQHLSPSLNFGQARKVLREFAGIGPSFPEAIRARQKKVSPDIPIAEKWAKRRRLKRGRRSGNILRSSVISQPSPASGPGRGCFTRGSLWQRLVCPPRCLSTCDPCRDSRPRLQGRAQGRRQDPFSALPRNRDPGAFRPGGGADRRAEPRRDRGNAAGTLYAATGGGMGPATIEAITHILAEMAAIPGAIFCSAADANAAGDRYALRHQELAAGAGLAFARLKPPIENGDWNDVLRNTKPAKEPAVNLPDFTQFEPLNRLKDEMGIPRDHYGAFPQAIHKPRAWILLPSGRRLDLLDPQPDAWTDEDLAIGLSRTYRWAGYSKWDLPLSVAQHSLAVLALREGSGPLTAREALREIAHDATEALMGGFDCIATLKPHLGLAFEQLDRRLQAAVDQRYQLPAWTDDTYAQHKHADRLAAASEAYHVVGWSLADMRESLGITLDPLDADPLTLPSGMQPWEPWPPKLAETLFLQRLTELLERAARDDRDAVSPGLLPSARTDEAALLPSAYRQQPHRHACLCRSRRRLSIARGRDR